MNAFQNSKNRQRGLSLIELMVAITLGLILTAAVIQVFVSSRGVFRTQDAMARLQENGRFAMSYLTQEVRMAGFMGCARLDDIPVNNIATANAAFTFDATTALTGADNVAAANAWNAVQGTDVLNIRGAAESSARLAGNTAPNNANIQLANEPGIPDIDAGDILLITDCTSADIFQTTNDATGNGTVITVAHATNVNTSNRLSKAYGLDAEVLAFRSLDYFIADTGRTTAAGAPINALFARQVDNVGDVGATPAPPFELVEAVQDMQIEYGEDTNDDRAADRYRSADQVADWTQVVSVRLNLLLQSTEDNIVGRAGQHVQNIQFMGAAVPQDGRLRQVVSTTVAIRNRLP